VNEGSPCRPHYGNLEALRGIAALVVVLHHLSLQPGTFLTGNPWLGQGWLFVDLFFVLSGFVIASVHAESSASETAAKGFLIRRFFRLWPLHLVTLIAALGLDILGGEAGKLGYGAMFVLNLTMTQAWGFVPGSVLNGPSWSISVEWAAYLLFAAVCLTSASLRRRLGIMATIGVISLTVLLVFRGGSLDGDLSLRLPRCLMSFSLGVLLWAWSRDRKPLIPRVATIGQAVVAAAMIVVLPCTAQIPSLGLAMPLLSAAMIAFMVRDPGSAARVMLDRRVPQWLGRHSYSLYLVHMPLFRWLSEAGADELPRTAWLVLSLAALGLVSAVTYRLVEVPWRDRGRSIARRAERSRSLGEQSLQAV
jgi:peptidoglycan/LPS O-acetylase OafA/YrhL